MKVKLSAIPCLPLFPWVVFLTHSSNVIKQNSEPEKCCPTNRTISSLLSWSKMNDITEAHYTKYFFYKLTATAFAVAVVLHQKTAVKLHSGFYSYLLFINRAFKP